MPCDLAVTITKAAVTKEHLLKLLTPRVVADLLTRFLQAKDKTARVMQPGSGPTVYASMGYYSISITRGQVTVRASNRADTKAADALAKELQQLIAGLADTLFAKQVQAAMASAGAKVVAQQHVVTTEGVKQIATVLNFDL
jgi:hypothetical protein